MQGRIFIFLFIVFLVDLYVFQAVKLATRSLTDSQARIAHLFYWSLTAITFVVLIGAVFVDWHTWPKWLRSYAFATVMIIFVSKLFVVLFLLFDDIIRFFRWALANVYERIYHKPIDTPANVSTITRSEFLAKVGLAAAAIPFVSLIYGMIKGAYNYQVKNVSLKFKNLPEAFSGFRIVQISDIHSGSFMSSEPLEKAVSIINELEADVIFFTGDLVNNNHEELLPHVHTLRKLTAKHGTYSTLGNHDYGDYQQWPSREAKINNLNRMKELHGEMGWKLMLDEHTFLERGDDKIGLVGVQNWSAHMRFPRYGSLEKATNNMQHAPVNILLSHDPSHWHAEVLDKYPQIDLMLAGHTHGFQFGVEIPGFKWSPVQYVYKEWADLYSKKDKHLYVNRGLGFIGYPGRVGILPEITVIELRKG